MSTEKESSKPAITSKPTAAHGGKKGKAMEAPVHPVSAQRRTVASDEEKREREARAAARHHGHHGGHGKDMGHEEHH